MAQPWSPPHLRPDRGRQTRVQITAPAETTSPTAADRPVTTPALWALIGCSIFIASRTTIRSPSATVSPSATAIFTIVPCIGLVSASPLAALACFLPVERWRAGPDGVLVPVPVEKPAGK